jgi:DNA-directed RNA polymerase specialized sigma subunit
MNPMVFPAEPAVTTARQPLSVNRPAGAAEPASSAGSYDRQRAVIDHMNIVTELAAELLTRRGDIEHDDLVRAGVLELIDTADCYDTGDNRRFDAFARPRVLAAMSAAINRT